MTESGAPFEKGGGSKPRPRLAARTRFKPARLKLSTSDAKQPLNTASLHDQLVLRLREMVLVGELRPGSPLPERMLCETFGVSRTPMREAFKVLASEGLIELRPHRTPMVMPVDRQDIAAVFEVMLVLDHLAAGLACLSATTAEIDTLDAMHARLVGYHHSGARSEYFRQNQDIHAEITRLAGNPVLLATWTALAAKIFRARAQANYDSQRWDESLHEHEGFMELLRRRDAERFATAIADHTRRTGKAVLASLDLLAKEAAQPA
ncbi:GntR family transcriptional regulator [Xanthobacter sp. DSM 24535]|uniref:GntR family transcriptional regulator n=1 Tax=Roseixanthobacter psychrophilus TaxID=3119917 RepID=UPI00372B2F1D